MRWDVILGDEVADWLDHLDMASYELIIAALMVLSEAGPALGRPLVDTITGSRIKNLKELRPGSKGRSEIRILFAFDPTRRAILLVAGDKAGNWKRWYKTNIPIAEDRWQEHLGGSR
ncbi:type II toxin-antitoxin system RelE/ParE family toxin [Paenarthrobacter sp. NPDC090520]|uniref:type II toxin-antitoxin system RelE/ParE family toxin n=1 Tax=Paenarthrobacter sp. NPDC090520 TaxID=3364382 RepID=UPI0037F7E11A